MGSPGSLVCHPGQIRIAAVEDLEAPVPQHRDAVDDLVEEVAIVRDDEQRPFVVVEGALERYVALLDGPPAVEDGLSQVAIVPTGTGPILTPEELEAFREP